MMMKNVKIKLLYIPLATLGVSLLEGCSTDDVFQPASPSIRPFEAIVVNDVGFEAGEGTRTADTGYSTTFVAGDAIGVSVISTKEGVTSIVQDNVKLTLLADGRWTSGVSSPLLRYDTDDISYIAYSPYSVTMRGMKSIDEIKAAFMPLSDQSTAVNYAASDLMTGMGTVNASGGRSKLSVTFGHAMSLLVVSPPIAGVSCVTDKIYSWSYHANARTYPSNVEITACVAGVIYEAMPWDDGNYRVLVKPGTPTSMQARYMLGDEMFYVDRPYTPVVGRYTMFTVETSAEVTNVARALRIGDFLVAENGYGQVMPAESEKADLDNLSPWCIVFYLGRHPHDDTNDYQNGDGEPIDIHAYALLAEAMQGATMCSAPQGSYATDDFNGYYNTRHLEPGYQGLPTLLPPLSFGYSPLRNADGWFVPSRGQFQCLLDNAAFINAQIDKMKGFALHLGHPEDTAWTSTPVADGVHDVNVWAWEEDRWVSRNPALRGASRLLLWRVTVF
ncbi:MAG: fimbrillin family protein [Mediterranea sp.]|jgi:hypothetical protein|nr:fimbrillin family protein [Mediterranea sp.]